jgi:hypothetical protein
MTAKTLKIAKHFVDKYAHVWSWDDEYSITEKTLPCTVFVQKVLKTELGRKLTTLERSRINIILPLLTFQRLVREGDFRVSGVVYAIVKGGLGRQVPLSRAKPGHYCQFWINGKGHSCIVHHIEGDQMWYISSNKSTHGPGVGGPIQLKERRNKRIWLAELK